MLTIFLLVLVILFLTNGIRYFKANTHGRSNRHGRRR